MMGLQGLFDSVRNLDESEQAFCDLFIERLQKFCDENGYDFIDWHHEKKYLEQQFKNGNVKPEYKYNFHQAVEDSKEKIIRASLRRQLKEEI